MKRALLIVAVVLLAVTPLQAQRGRIAESAPGENPAVWLRANALPLTTVEAGGDEADLRPLLPLVRGARAVALGDATHGTHELFAMKQRLVPFLVEQAGVRTIIFEAPYAEFQRLSDYVRTGAGDPAAMLTSSDYYFWDTDEVLAVIQWARAWNRDPARPRVDVAGVDCFHPHTTIVRLLDYLRRVDPPAADDAVRRYSCLQPFADSPLSYGAVAPSFRGSCRASIESVRPLIAAHRDDYARRSSDAEADEAIHAARIVEQGEESLATGMANRDEAMADNIAWLMDRDALSGVVIWGHNEHFGKVPYTLYKREGTVSSGTRLAARYGAGYVAIGSVVLRGTFNAAEFVNGNGYIAPFPFAASGQDDYASYFSQAGLARMIVPLRGALPGWLVRPHPLRIAGSNILSRPRPTVELVEELAKKFDAVIYLETSSPTLLRHVPVIGQ